MRRSSDERARDRKAFEEADVRCHETALEAERVRHEEVMEALRAQSRNFEAQNRRLDAQTRSLDAQTDALKALLLRIVPAAPAE